MLGTSFKLPCGVLIPNRIVKSAMSENMADKGGRPSDALIQLYERWGKGGAGIIVSGNIMMDHRALGEPYNVIVEDDKYLEALIRWGEACQKHGCHLWAQINHPGRQAPRLNKELVSPSDVQVPMGKMFAKPRPLTEDEIWEIIEGFGNTASMIKAAGWKGVQIHGAHGYLVSQFLSTRTNLRKDQWGGSLENRARFVTEIYKNIRSKVGDDFPVGIKINSADFQKGAFTEEESLEVIDMLSALNIDLIEISGGTYERSAMMGTMQKESTKQREAYFADFIIKARKRTRTPLMLTGGFRTKEVMEQALENDELDFIGIARPFANDPDVASKLLSGEITDCKLQKLSTGIKKIDVTGVLEIAWYADQLKRMGSGKEPSEKVRPWKVLGSMFWEQAKANIGIS